jgi:hypothetical protein
MGKNLNGCFGEIYNFTFGVALGSDGHLHRIEKNYFLNGWYGVIAIVQ